MELDISSNWFGIQGLEKFKTVFGQFINLKKLNLSNNKLCVNENNETRHFREALLAV